MSDKKVVMAGTMTRLMMSHDGRFRRRTELRMLSSFRKTQEEEGKLREIFEKSSPVPKSLYAELIEAEGIH